MTRGRHPGTPAGPDDAVCGAPPPAPVPALRTWALWGLLFSWAQAAVTDLSHFEEGSQRNRGGGDPGAPLPSLPGFRAFADPGPAGNAWSWGSSMKPLGAPRMAPQGCTQAPGCRQDPRHKNVRWASSLAAGLGVRADHMHGAPGGDLPVWSCTDGRGTWQGCGPSTWGGSHHIPSIWALGPPTSRMSVPPPRGEAIAPRAAGLLKSRISSTWVSLDEWGRWGRKSRILRWVLGPETPTSPNPRRPVRVAMGDGPSVLSSREAGRPLWAKWVWAAWVPTEVTVCDTAIWPGGVPNYFI